MTRYTTQHIVPYAPERLFDLVADVESYPEFLPWWVAARTRDRQEGGYTTDQVIAFGPARVRFQTDTRLVRPHRIEVTSADRRFRCFRLLWSFDPAPDGACRIGLDAEVAFRSRVLDRLLGRAVAEGLAGIVEVFDDRARRSFGPPPKSAWPKK